MKSKQLFFFLTIDFLSLDFLECIPLDDADTLRSIGSLVPHLNNARFSADSDCIDELESILNGWPKVMIFQINIYFFFKSRN